MYKLYVLSSKESQLPYRVNGLINDKSKEIIWKYIGEVDNYIIATKMVMFDKDCYSNNYCVRYSLNQNPSGNNNYDFCKIVAEDGYTSYYDIYHNDKSYKFKRRILSMNLTEHKVARIVVKDEVLSMIEDFKNGNPILRECDWQKGEKNYTFKNEFFNKTGRELTDKVIKHSIITELVFKNFVDVIYPQWCKTEENCIQAIKDGHLYWVFHIENFETYDCHANDVNIGDLYIKLEPISGEFYIVKSLHTPDILDCDGEFTERDMSMIQIYDNYINDRI